MILPKAFFFIFLSKKHLSFFEKRLVEHYSSLLSFVNVYLVVLLIICEFYTHTHTHMGNHFSAVLHLEFCSLLLLCKEEIKNKRRIIHFIQMYIL